MPSKRQTLLFSFWLLITAGVLSAKALPEWNAGYQGEIPDLPVVATVAVESLEALGHAAIQEAIDGVDGGGAVLLPEGEFDLHGPISMRSGVVLRGAGVDKTFLRFHEMPADEFDGVFRPAFGRIRFEGSRRAEEYAIEKGYERGSDCLKMSELGELEVGQMILVFSENDPELLYTEARWERPWAAQSLAQIVEVVKIKKNKVFLDVPLRLTYKNELRPRVLIIDPIVEAGVEDIKIENTDPDCDHIIGLENARNCWVRRLETIYSTRGHIWINFSRFVTVSENVVHHSFSYGSGGRGYGIVAGNVVTDSLVTDNVLHHLRHALMVKRGANGNVFSYNYSFERRRDPEGDRLLCDISLHGHYPYQNLFEGNVVEFIELADYWGPTGPYTTFVRNVVELKIEVADHSHGAIFLGNKIIEEGFVSDGTSRGLYLNGNTTGNGELLPSNRMLIKVPTSAYLSEAPDGWGDLPWPVLSGGEGVSVHIPAQRRWLEEN